MDWVAELFPRFAAGLSSYKAKPGKAVGRCPNAAAHRRDDKRPSLVMKLADNGGLIFSCLSGCRKPDVLLAAGCNWRDVCWDRPREGKAVSQLVRAYEYRDPDGLPAYEVCRYHPKNFRPRRKVLDLTGDEWVYTLQGGPVARSARDGREPYWSPSQRDAPGAVTVPPAILWPYNADLVEAAPASKLVLWVEGEGCADTLTGMGFLATTLPGGAAARCYDRHVWKLFSGRNVVVLPDHDRAGVEYAAFVAGCLILARAASVAELRLPGLPPKGDVTDWELATRAGPDDRGPAGTPAAALRELVRQVAVYHRVRMLDVFGRRPDSDRTRTGRNRSRIVQDGRSAVGPDSGSPGFQDAADAV
ncbi:MAG: hypothetical protein K2X82_08300 [Gemmataceae bacterium]|nr:hypothetical protein [Gemmataceae bacterium]